MKIAIFSRRKLRFLLKENFAISEENCDFSSIKIAQIAMKIRIYIRWKFRNLRLKLRSLLDARILKRSRCCTKKEKKNVHKIILVSYKSLELVKKKFYGNTRAHTYFAVNEFLYLKRVRSGFC